jgi:hypothetical protein
MVMEPHVPQVVVEDMLSWHQRWLVYPRRPAVFGVLAGSADGSLLAAAVETQEVGTVSAPLNRLSKHILAAFLRPLSFKVHLHTMCRGLGITLLGAQNAWVMRRR